jgi:hypothetical protein
LNFDKSKGVSTHSLESAPASGEYCINFLMESWRFLGALFACSDKRLEPVIVSRRPRFRIHVYDTKLISSGNIWSGNRSFLECVCPIDAQAQIAYSPYHCKRVIPYAFLSKHLSSARPSIRPSRLTLSLRSPYTSTPKRQLLPWGLSHDLVPNSTLFWSCTD